jgi:calcineurin-like phosphoesterase family protein
MQQIFFTADTHFGHTNILEFTERPFTSIQEHDEALIDNINKAVGKRDFLYHLGDFCFASTARQQVIFAKEILSKIRCKNIHLILGNHDPRSKRGQPREDFSALFTSCTPYHIVRIPEALVLEDMLSAPKQMVILNHYAIRSWEGMHKGTYHLYGHSHATLPDNGTRSFDVGVDAVALRYGLIDTDNYRPMSSYEIHAILKDSDIRSLDGHHLLQEGIKNKDHTSYNKKQG